MLANSLILQGTERFPSKFDELSKMDALHCVLEEILQKYNSVITLEDNPLLAKQDIKEVREIKKGIKNAEKAIVAELEKPIREIKSNFVVLIEKCSQVEKTISERINLFLNQEREKLQNILGIEIQRELQRLFMNVELRQRISIQDLLKSPSKCLTKTGALTKYAREEIEIRVEKLRLQNQAEEQQKPALELQAHYTQSIIKQTIETQPSKKSIQNLSSLSIIETQRARDSKVSHKKKRKLIVVFQVEVDKNVSDEVLEQKLKEKLLNSGFKSLCSITTI